MAGAVPDVKLLATGGQFRNLRDLFREGPASV